MVHDRIIGPEDIIASLGVGDVMAQMTVEVVEIGDLSPFDVHRALALANSVQHEFLFTRLDDRDAAFLRDHVYDNPV
jgi:hypothetical protein